MNEQNKNSKLGAAASDELERQRIRKAALIKLGAMLVLSVILLIFSSMHMQIKQMTDETA